MYTRFQGLHIEVPPHPKYITDSEHPISWVDSRGKHTALSIRELRSFANQCLLIANAAERAAEGGPSGQSKGKDGE